VISGPLRDVVEKCAFLGYSAAKIGTSIPTFRDNLLFPFSRNQENFLALEDGKNRLSRNLGTKVQPFAADYSTRVQISELVLL